MSEFEKLIVWFEKADDPWFDEKRSSKLRDLQAMQRYFCPCEDMRKIWSDASDACNDLLIRANVISLYLAQGTIVKTANGTNAHIIPPVHVDKCTCRHAK